MLGAFSSALGGLPSNGILGLIVKIVGGFLAFCTVAGTLLGILKGIDKLPWTKVPKGHVGIRLWSEVEVRVKSWHKYVFFWRKRLPVGTVRITKPGHPFFVPFKGGVYSLSLQDRSTDVDKVLHFWKKEQHWAGGSFAWNVKDDRESYVLAWSKGEDLTKQVSDILNRAFSQALPTLHPLQVSDPKLMKEAMLPFCKIDLAELGVYLRQANTYPQGHTMPHAIMQSGASPQTIRKGLQDEIQSDEAPAA
jgi:hypothetical protein